MGNQYTVKAALLQEAQRKEIFWNFVNAGLAGGIAFLSSMATAIIDGMNFKDLCLATGSAVVTFGLVALIEFQAYWKKEQGEYSNTIKLFNFIH